MAFKDLDIEKEIEKMEFDVTDNPMLKDTLTKEQEKNGLSGDELQEAEKVADQILKEVDEEMENDKMCEVKESILSIREKQQQVVEDQHKIVKNFSHHNKFTYGLMFVAGTAFGMSDSKWIPYASWIWELGREIIFKGGN